MDHILFGKASWNLGQRVYTVLVSPADSTFDCSWLGLLSIHCRFRHVEANLLGPMPTRAYLVKGQLEDTTWGCRMTGLVWLGHTWNAVVFACRMIESLALHQIGHSLRLLFIIGICIYYAFYKLSSSHTKTGGCTQFPIEMLSCTQEHISGGRLRLLGHDEVTAGWGFSSFWWTDLKAPIGILSLCFASLLCMKWLEKQTTYSSFAS